METKTITIDEMNYELVTKRVATLKPIRTNGSIRYSMALFYLTRVLPYNEPSLAIILNLASFAMSNRLSEKQAKLADKFISYWEEKGVL